MTQDDLTTDVRKKAHDVGREAANAAYSQADRAVSGVADQAADRVSNVANAADAAADEFSDESLQARAAHQVAAQVEGFAARLRTADLGSATRDVSQFARENPALFIGGAALLGFAATRFLKARNPARVDHDASAGDPWGSPGQHNPTSRGFDVAS